jgi:hypothetical protein
MSDDDDNIAPAPIFPGPVTLARRPTLSSRPLHVTFGRACLRWVMALLADTLVRLGVSNPVFLIYIPLTVVLSVSM